MRNFLISNRLSAHVRNGPLSKINYFNIILNLIYKLYFHAEQNSKRKNCNRWLVNNSPGVLFNIYMPNVFQDNAKESCYGNPFLRILT